MTSLFESNNRFTRSYLLAVLFSLLILTSSLFSVPKSFTITSNVQGFEEENTSNQDDGSTQYEKNDKGTNDNTQESDGDFSSTSTGETGGLNREGARNYGSQDKVGSNEATENDNDHSDNSNLVRKISYNDNSTGAQDGTSSDSDKSQGDAAADSSSTKMPPKADAGDDIITNEGDTVVLNAERSTDSDGNIEAYHWSQIEGPQELTIDNIDTVFPKFKAPSVSSDTRFQFDLTVTDNDGLSDSDSVYVTIRDVDGSTENIQNSELSTNTNNFTQLKDLENNKMVNHELDQNYTQQREEIESNTNTNKLFDNQLSDGPIEQALLNRSDSTEQQRIQTDEALTSADSNQAIPTEVNSYNSTKESDDIITMAISNTTQTPPINSTELQNMTGPIINSTQPINSTELQNMTGPIINSTQPINSTELQNMTGPIINGTEIVTGNNKSTIDLGSLSASLVETETKTAYNLKLLSYVVNGTEIKINDMSKDTDFSLNNSAKVELVSTNSSTKLETTDMALEGTDGIRINLKSTQNGKWSIDAPTGIYSLLVDAKYSPESITIHYGALIKVVGEKNLPPIADAGKDHTVKGNISVILDGSKSLDPDGNISSYHWSQTNGEPFVSLFDVDTSKASFISPSNLKNESNLTFELSVTDNDAVNSTDTVIVTLMNTTIPVIPGTLSLEPVRRILPSGQLFEFKGLLNLSKIPDGSYVQIRNNNTGKYSELLTFGPVEKDGKFTAPWTATPRKNLMNIYASYVDISGNEYKSNSSLVRVIGFKSSPGISTQPESKNPEPVKVNPTSPPAYMELHFSDWTKDHLNVYIAANDPPSQKYIGDSKRAISDLSKILKEKTGNGGAWNFDIFTSNEFPSPLVTNGQPINIFFSLTNIADEFACGYNHPFQRKAGEYISNEVFTDSGCPDVYSDTVHEFLHSLGLGHTWHEHGDLMCSAEWYFGTGARTCEDNIDHYNDNNVPTELNVRALVSEYGENGFQEPNMNVPVNYNPYTDTKYYCNPLPCEPQKANSPPIANAGVDQSPDTGAKVILDGTKSSDSDGTITSYSWHQLAGPSVKLYKPTSPNPYFYVPSPLETSTKLSFELTVTDDKGFNAADTVNIKANVPTTEQEKTNTIKKSTAPNNIEQDIFKVVVRLANIRQELGYDNSAILLKGNLFQKQELSYLIANNSTIAETTFAFPSTLIKTGESFVVCVKQSSIKGEEGIECKIGVNSSPIGTGGLNFTLPQSGKLASDSITIPQINYNTQAVEIVDGASSPNNQKHLVPFFVKVSKGDHVVWKNEDSVTHTITSGSPKGTNSGSIFNSGNLASGKIFEYTFIKLGKYDYYCKIHPFIIGEISVN